MKKIIDIEEDQKESLQILAVKSGKDLKNYIQDVLSVKHQYQDRNQVTRAVLNDIRQTFESIEGNYYEGENLRLDTIEQYCDLVIAMCKQIQAIEIED